MLVGLALFLSPSALAAGDTGVGTGSTDTDTTCSAEGDPCTADDGGDGLCDADLTCIADDEPTGCATGGAAAGWLAMALGGLALRRRR